MRTAEEILKEKDKDIISVSPDTSLYDVLQLMVKNNIGAMLVKESGKIVGIWTERDLMRNVIQKDFDLKKAQIGDYMTKSLKSVPHTSSLYNLEDKFLGMRLRHLLIEKGGEYIGMLSVGDVIRASLLAKSKEVEELNAKFNFDYYEDWKWKKKGPGES